LTITGANVLQGFSEFIKDYESSTTTSAGNSAGTTLVDTYMSRYGDGRLSGQFIRLTSGTSTLQIRRISDNTQSTGTITVSPAFSAQVATSVTYQLHKYDPNLKFLAIDKARLDVIDTVYRLIYDDSITSDGRTTVYDIPSTIEVGPILAISESPITPDAEWNLLTNPRGDSLTGWTASSTTATTYTRNEADLLVPKYQDTATKLVTAASTAATYTQVVADMSDNITAAKAADRKMCFAAWVYCTEASKISLRLLDDSGTLATGTAHSGGGWELLFVEGTPAGNNSTTLSVQFVISSTANASTIYWENAWFYYGNKERVCDEIFRQENGFDVRRDEATQQVVFTHMVPRGRQVRLVGKTALTSLGTVAASQITNTMEITSGTAEILYARAAEILYGWERVDSEDVESVMQRIAMVSGRQSKLTQNYGQEPPRHRMRTPFS
jgi:hypothetical protein